MRSEYCFQAALARRYERVPRERQANTDMYAQYWLHIARVKTVSVVLMPIRRRQLVTVDRILVKIIIVLAVIFNYDYCNSMVIERLTDI